MRRALSAVFVHAVWATWDRLPFLTPEVEAAVYADVRAECARLGVELLEIGGIEDPVHILVRVPATVCVADLIKQVKGASSHLATHHVTGPGGFRWQGGYAAFSVSQDGLPAARAYIRDQKRHHRDGSAHDSCEPD